MSSLSLITMLSVLCAIVQPNPIGTNGAGTNRGWTAVDGRWNGSITGAFFSVSGGNVILSLRQNLSVKAPLSPQTPKQTVRISGYRNIPISVPLAILSASDRRWIEARNPLETCLTGKSRRGAVGTLTPTRGKYRIVEISGDKALIEHVVDDQPIWTFWLRSHLVPLLSTYQQYDSISFTLVKNFDNLPQIDRERYGIDFRIVGKQTKKGKNIDLVEDNR